MQGAAAEEGIANLKIRLQGQAAPMDEGVDIWNMCVLQWVDTGEDAASALLRLQRNVAGRLGSNARGYRPHMSLGYGVVPFKTRQQLATKVSAELLPGPTVFEADAVVLVETPVPAGPEGVSREKSLIFGCIPCVIAASHSRTQSAHAHAHIVATTAYTD